MNEYVIIIFGASGDLVKRKLMPALFSLIKNQAITKWCIVGAAVDAVSAEEILTLSKPFMYEVDEDLWKRFKDNFFYYQLDFRNQQDYFSYKEYIDVCKKKCGLATAHTLIYCATSSHFFCDITSGVAQSGIAQRSIKNELTWTRLIYEKPFGYDLVSAHAINNCIASFFNEDQVYRIDHYLTKELVGNIALVRFTNLVFEPLWNNRYIDNVQIVLHEEESVGSRGQYYDHFGAISDVMQNHMLELLALIGMEAPTVLLGNYVRDERAKVLKKVQVVDVCYGQYEGYTQEPFIPENSKTETFAAAYVRIENKRWAGVPFYLKTGKCLKKKETKIYIKFKSVDCLLSSCPVNANVLTIEISPQAGFLLRLNAKKPGEAHEVIPVTMEFCHSCIFGYRDEQAYKTLLEGVIKGEQSVSVRFDEIEYAWHIIDTLKRLKRPVFTYPCGSQGPKELEDFNKKHGIKWLS